MSEPDIVDTRPKNEDCFRPGIFTNGFVAICFWPDNWDLTTRIYLSGMPITNDCLDGDRRSIFNSFHLPYACERGHGYAGWVDEGELWRMAGEVYEAVVTLVEIRLNRRLPEDISKAELLALMAITSLHSFENLFPSGNATFQAVENELCSEFLSLWQDWRKNLPQPPRQGPKEWVRCCNSPLWGSTRDCENCGGSVRSYYVDP